MRLKDQFNFWKALLLICLFCASCNRNAKTDLYRKKNPELEIIKVPEYYDNVFPNDTLIDKYYFIPLETRDECLIGSISGLQYFDDKFYILDRNAGQILVFDTGGKFLAKISPKGRGPGEYSLLRDYKIDNEGNIYVLSFNRILKYSNTGGFVEQYEFDFNNYDNTGFNPVQFCLDGNEGFYLWRGSLGFDKDYNGKFFALYHLDKKKKVKGKYFSLTAKLFGGLNIFYGTEGDYYMQSFAGNDTIYHIGRNGLSARYYVDFGKRKLNRGIISGEEQGSSLYSKILTQTGYSLNIDNIFETERYLYFIFANGKEYWRNTYYSRYSKRTLTGTIKTLIASPVLCTFGNSFVTVINKRYLVSNSLKSGRIEEEIKKSLKYLNDLDNPVLLVYSLKDF